MKQLIFSFFLLFSISYTSFCQTQEQTPDVFEQFQKDIESMMQDFEQMPDFSRIWSDTLFFKEFDLKGGEEGYSDMEFGQFDMQEMMQWMEKQFEQMNPDQGAPMEDWFQQFDFKVDPLVPAPEKVPDSSAEPKEEFPVDKKRKKRKVYSM